MFLNGTYGEDFVYYYSTLPHQLSDDYSYWAIHDPLFGVEQFDSCLSFMIWNIHCLRYWVASNANVV